MNVRLDFTTADLLNCTICIREFDTRTRKPKVLFCGHTICEECTVQLKDSDNPPTIRCPVCRNFTSRSHSHQFVTNFQIMAFLAEKEKQELEKIEKEKKGKKANPRDEHFQFRMNRNKSLKVHVATKKDLKSPEMFLRKDADGGTSVVIVGKTGSPEEIVKYVNENGIGIETGTFGTRIVYDESGGHQSSRFAKVSNIGAGQSALKCTNPPERLEDVEFTVSYELKASEDNGSLRLELVQNGELPEGFKVFDGCMTKPSAKRLRELTGQTTSTNKNTPSTSAPVVEVVEVVEPEGPVSKRTRRARGK